MLRNPRAVAALATLKTLLELGVLAVFVAWGIMSFPLPTPGYIVAAVAGLVAILVWALFLSPRPVLRTDRFARSLVALVFYSAAAAAAFMLELGTAAIILCYVALLVITYLENTPGEAQK